MSLETAGVWQVGVWATTVWADGVWREGEYVAVTVLVSRKMQARFEKKEMTINAEKTTMIAR